MSHNIHINCVSNDQPLAEAIAADLRARGANVTISQPTDSRFALGAAKTIERSDAVLLLFSSRAVESVWVQAEIAWALQAEKNIIPVMVEPIFLLDFLFLLGLGYFDLQRQPLDQVLDALASRLYLDGQGTGLQTMPDSLADAAPEPPLQNLFDEADVETLFFAAAELAHTQPERAIFVYRFVLSVNPDYAGGSARSLVERESARLKPSRLKQLADEADAAANEQDWRRVKQFIEGMTVLETNSPMIAKIKARVATLRLTDFYQQANAAVDAAQWDEIERVISEVTASIDDAELVEAFTTQTREKQLNRLLELANQALNKKEWAAAQDYAERIHDVAPDNPQVQQIIESIQKGRIAAYVSAAHQAIDAGNWEQAESIRNELFELSRESDEARLIGRRMKLAKAEGLIRDGRKYVEQKNLADLQAVMAALKNIDPLNDALVSFQLLAEGMQAIIQQQEECEALYQQAIHAHTAGRMGAVITFLRHINETCPDVGDPQGLVGDEIRAETAVLVRKLQSIPMTRDKPTGVAFSPDASVLAIANNYSGVILWDVETSGINTTLKTYVARTLAFSPDGSFLASAGGTNYISLWGGDGEFIRHIDVARSGASVFGIAFSPGSTALAVASSEGEIVLVGVDEGKLLATFTGHRPYVSHCVAFAPDGSYLASGGGDKGLRLYEPPELRKSKAAAALTWLPRRNPTEELGNSVVEMLNASVYSVAFAPRDEVLLAAGRGDGIISFMTDISARYPNLERLQAHTGVVNSLAFSPDGSLLVSGSSDATVKIWDMRDGTPAPEPLAVLTGHSAEITSVAFSSDNRYIATASADNSVRLWGLGKPFDDKPKR